MRAIFFILLTISSFLTFAQKEADFLEISNLIFKSEIIDQKFIDDLRQDTLGRKVIFLGHRSILLNPDKYYEIPFDLNTFVLLCPYKYIFFHAPLSFIEIVEVEIDESLAEMVFHIVIERYIVSEAKVLFYKDFDNWRIKKKRIKKMNRKHSLQPISN